MSRGRSHARSAAILTAAVLGAASGCSDPVGEARLEGFAEVDLVSGSELLGGDSREDAMISLRLVPDGTITTLTVQSVDGQQARWDTIPENSFWALGVVDEAGPGELLNAADGSVNIDAKGTNALRLYLADNGAVRDGKTRFSVSVGYADGRQEEISVE